MDFRRPEQRFKGSVYLTVAAVLAMIPFFYLCKYVYPVNDDFSFALQHFGTNCFTSVVEIWENWSGRYFATFISALNPFVVSDSPLELFRVFSAIVVAMFVASFLGLPMLAVSRKLSRIESVGFGALMLLIFIAFFPSVSQAFYWFSSYTAYTIPCFLYLCLIALACRKDKVSFFFACILALIVPGGNEVTAVLCVCSLIYLSVTYNNSSLKKYS